MKLFVDLDCTLIRSWHPHDGDPPPNTRAHFHSAKEDGIRRSVHIRPDVNFLAKIPFSVFTAATLPYARPIVKELKRRGLRIRRLYTWRHLSDVPYPMCRALYKGPCALIDDLIFDTKLNRLPGGVLLRVNPFELVPKKDGSSTPRIQKSTGSSLRSCVESYLKLAKRHRKG